MEEHNEKSRAPFRKLPFYNVDKALFRFISFHSKLYYIVSRNTVTTANSFICHTVGLEEASYTGKKNNN